MRDPAGVSSYSYDSLNRLTNKAVWFRLPNGNTNTDPVRLNYAYDALGTLTNLWSSTPGGVTLRYAYDLLGRLTNALGDGGTASYGFDAVGNLQSVRYGNGVTNLYQYDARNRLTNLVWKAGTRQWASFAYQVGPTGQRTALSETNNGAVRNYSWGYDRFYRLTQEVLSGGSSGTLGYGYDPVGNRTNRSSSLGLLPPATASYDANDRLLSDTYDNNGNTLSAGGKTWQYDALDHLTNLNNGAVLLTYDGDGQRVRKTVGTTSTYYLVDDRNPSGYAQVLEEYTATGSGTPNLQRIYDYGLSLISQREIGDTIYYFVSDGH